MTGRPIAIAFRLLFIKVIVLSSAAYAKEAPKYVVGKIAPEMKEGVNAVYWEDKATYRIFSRSKATYTVMQAVTILNSQAADLAKLTVGYDRLCRVTEIRAAVYDASGHLIRKIRNNEIRDVSAFDGYSLFSDNRLKAVDLSFSEYPYTIEYEYEVEYRFILNIPGFILLPGEGFSSLYAEYNLIYPKELKPRFLTRGIESDPVVVPVDPKTESTSWKFQNIRPVIIESLGPPASEVIPTIHAAPTHFEVDGYEGTMEDWASFGKWVNSINKGRNTLPPETKEKVRALTAQLSDPKEKVKALYRFMQNRTRYVSIQLGIGGWQPFPASVVDENGYGDCKALSNYMVSLLEAIDIKAHYVLIQADQSNRKFNPLFPGSQFNHAVVCVPLSTDTVWLECTSQTNPFGYMGSLTGNRKALAITDDGAVIVNTPAYGPDQNRLVRSANVSLDEKGNGVAHVETVYSGMQSETKGLNFVPDRNADAQKKWIMRTTDIPSFHLNSFRIALDGDRLPVAKVEMDLQLRQSMVVNGKRFFLTPNLMNRSSFTPKKVEQRKSAVVLTFGHSDFDTIRYTLPENIYSEHIPEPVKLSSRFGEYESSCMLEDGKIIYRRKLVVRNGEYPPEAYNELVDFLKGVNRADNMKLVFLSKT